MSPSFGPPTTIHPQDLLVATDVTLGKILPTGLGLYSVRDGYVDHSQNKWENHATPQAKCIFLGSKPTNPAGVPHFQ